MIPDETLSDEIIAIGSGSAQKDRIAGNIAPKTPEPLIGKKAYRSYLKKNIIRPQDPDGKKIRGKVIVEFQVGT